MHLAAAGRDNSTALLFFKHGLKEMTYLPSVGTVVGILMRQIRQWLARALRFHSGGMGCRCPLTQLYQGYSRRYVAPCQSVTELAVVRPVRKSAGKTGLYQSRYPPHHLTPHHATQTLDVKYGVQGPVRDGSRTSVLLTGKMEKEHEKSLAVSDSL